MTTPANNIPWVPENTQDPAAGLNDALRVIDALLQCAVIDMSTTAPPGSPADGAQYIVASGATGAWSGHVGELARYVADGDFWEFYTPLIVFNRADGGLYSWDGSGWILAAGLSDAPHTGQGYVRKDGVWVLESGGGGSGDVSGPASSTDGNVALFNGTSGKSIEDGGTLGSMAFEADAQSDGSSYVRKNGSWVAESTGSSDVLDVTAPSNVAGTVTLDFDGASRYAGAITLSANVTTLAFSNLPGSGKFAEYELHIKQDGTGGRTFAIPASHKALGGSDTSIASAANSVTVLTASTVDNGTTWRYAMQESA